MIKTIVWPLIGVLVQIITLVLLMLAVWNDKWEEATFWLGVFAFNTWLDKQQK